MRSISPGTCWLRHFENRLELGVFCRAESRGTTEFLSRQTEQLAQAAVLSQQVPGEIDRIAAGDTGAQEDRQQFGVGQRSRALAQEFFTGAFGVGPVGDSHGVVVWGESGGVV